MRTIVAFENVLCKRDGLIVTLGDGQPSAGVRIDHQHQYCGLRLEVQQRGERADREPTAPVTAGWRGSLRVSSSRRRWVDTTRKEERIVEDAELLVGEVRSCWL